MRYFVKDYSIHKYPIPKKCGSMHVDEVFHISIPVGFKRCDDCFPQSPR